MRRYLLLLPGRLLLRPSLLSSLLLGSLLLGAALAARSADWVQGSNYFLLRPALPTSVAPGKV